MTREEAIAAARLSAEWEGWRWFEPVQAMRKRPLFSRQPYWEVQTGVRRSRCDFQIRIDDATGKVTQKRYFSR